MGLVKIFALLLVSFIFLNCEGDIAIDYEFTDLTVEHAEHTGATPVVNTLDSIPAAAYVLRLNLFPVELSRSRGRYLDTETAPRNTNPIDSINITTTIDFDETHPAGTSLNAYFIIFNHSFLHHSTLDDPYITNVGSELFFEEPLPKYADLLLMNPPESGGDFVFTVYLELRNGTSFIQNTESIRIYK